MTSDINLAHRRFNPSVDAMRRSLPDLAESVTTGCLELERELTLDRLDALLDRWKAGHQNLIYLRRAIIAEQVERHGTG